MCIPAQQTLARCAVQNQQRGVLITYILDPNACCLQDVLTYMSVSASVDLAPVSLQCLAIVVSQGRGRRGGEA